MMQQVIYPVQFSVDYPDRNLNPGDHGIPDPGGYWIVAYAVVLATDRYPPFRLAP
jgi:hypothetical protein